MCRENLEVGRWSIMGHDVWKLMHASGTVYSLIGSCPEYILLSYIGVAVASISCLSKTKYYHKIHLAMLISSISGGSKPEWCNKQNRCNWVALPRCPWGAWGLRHCWIWVKTLKLYVPCFGIVFICCSWQLHSKITLRVRVWLWYMFRVSMYRFVVHTFTGSYVYISESMPP